MMVIRIMIHKSMCAVEKVAQGKGGWDCCSFNEGGKHRPHWAIDLSRFEGVYCVDT